MQLKHIGIAAVIAAGCLVAARPWAQADRVGAVELAAQDSQARAGTSDAGTTDGTGRFDSYTQGHRTGRFDPYAEGMGHPVVDLIWLQGNT